MKTLTIENFLADKNIRLEKFPTHLDIEASEKKKQKALDKVTGKISEIQEKMYAYNKYSVLICLQGMDTAGKDSLIREVFKDFNPRGMVVSSFKTPNSAELEHDYLWRHYIALPERGKFAVFNRTHYENVLVTRVHPEYILKENLPTITKVEDIDKGFWESRFEQINNFEKHITANGTIILKFFLHLSKEEQRQRLIRRLEKEKHNWKFSPDDLKEREHWDEYQEYYEEAIAKTSTNYAPWYIVPADNKETARFIVADIIHQQLEKYTDIKNPELDDAIKDNITVYRRALEEEK
ncbi:PPK2 family polyphosphate kinase [Flavobacterium kingsejongi]|uniref:Phosphate--nucleotide phosphotransferase n=1 Tax=Flavobacterium kingsejongi TaxID=1678728 RepID=A0A2S1LT93_9FLAO|nr:PPK2 family polyphosphate kinase [Flavobacterium kingsejongi]AWG26902.1 phosphate--nucleotide phosphotransferase [Flavobacterium kingsejongi]